MDADKLDILRQSIDHLIEKAREEDLDPVFIVVFDTDEEAMDASEWISQEYPGLRFMCCTDPFGTTMEDPYGTDRYKPCPN